MHGQAAFRAASRCSGRSPRGRRTRARRRHRAVDLPCRRTCQQRSAPSQLTRAPGAARADGAHARRLGRDGRRDRTYQTGLLRRLPDPPLPGIDSAKVDASGEAYEFLKTPDATLALASYGASLALIGRGGAERARERPLVTLLAAAKLGYDAVGAGYLTAEQISRHRALCAWCLAAAAASIAAVPLGLPEAREAWRTLRS